MSDASSVSSSSSSSPPTGVAEAQLRSLDDADAHASAWSEALLRSDGRWGGRGRGGRGRSRRTRQPSDVVVPDVALSYVGDATAGAATTLLADATLKLLSGRAYAMVGWNGCGKSTLLRRIASGKIPGFPPHVTTMYVPQEVFSSGGGEDGDDGDDVPLEAVRKRCERFAESSSGANRLLVEELERELEAVDLSAEDGEEKVQALCDRISSLESSDGRTRSQLDEAVLSALRLFDVDETTARTVPLSRLSGGRRKTTRLSAALVARPDLVLLDEPTNHLDVAGLLGLRRFLDALRRPSEGRRRGATALMVSHDVDLINDAATDVIHFHDKSLDYYVGNYNDFLRDRRQSNLAKLRQNNALEKQRQSMVKTIRNLSKQAKTDNKKKKVLNSRKKKLERHGLEKDAHGHRRTCQKAGTGIKEGSINGIDRSTRNKLSHTQLLKRAEVSVAPVPDKAIQFVFPKTTCTWGEPLIMLMDVGHGYPSKSDHKNDDDDRQEAASEIATQTGTDDDPETTTTDTPLLFDCVDLCIQEHSTTCVLGASGSGKSTLLRILAGAVVPTEGSVHTAHNVSVGLFDQHGVDDLVRRASSSSDTALSLLAALRPSATEADLRAAMSAFGLVGPRASATSVRFLSGGERCRLRLADLALGRPDVLLMDEPTNHLDAESVDALVHGLKGWGGTVVAVSHDAHLVRALGGTCVVLFEGKLRRLDRDAGGVDAYIRAVSKEYRDRIREED